MVNALSELGGVALYLAVILALTGISELIRYARRKSHQRKEVKP